MDRGLAHTSLTCLAVLQLAGRVKRQGSALRFRSRSTSPPSAPTARRFHHLPPRRSGLLSQRSLQHCLALQEVDAIDAGFKAEAHAIASAGSLLDRHERIRRRTDSPLCALPIPSICAPFADLDRPAEGCAGVALLGPQRATGDHGKKGQCYRRCPLRECLLTPRSGLCYCWRIKEHRRTNSRDGKRL